MSSLYSYVITHDTGFAPNPFAGFLTLATCKPKIRRTARPGDWLLGTGSTRNVGHDRVIYAAEIHEVLPLEIYGSHPAFEIKAPAKTGEPWRRHGDNIYFRDRDGSWNQRRETRITARSIVSATWAGRMRSFAGATGISALQHHYCPPNFSRSSSADLAIVRLRTLIASNS